MDIHVFNQLCKEASLPVINSAQWESLIDTDQGKLLARDSNGSQPVLPLSLELFVRSVSTTLQPKLEALGYTYSLQQILDIAQREGKLLFAALHKCDVDQDAVKYIQSLGFAKLPRPPVPAPYYSFHVYSTKSALCFSEAQNRKGQFTVNVEGAPLLQKSTNAYDWGSKIILQLFAEEMFLVLAVLNGKLNSIQFNGHGEKHDKVMEFNLQSSHYFVRLIQKNRTPIFVPMMPVNAVNLTSLLYQQIKKNHPHLDMPMLSNMEDQLVRMHVQSTHRETSL
jgi:hypothetical protein